MPIDSASIAAVNSQSALDQLRELRKQVDDLNRRLGVVEDKPMAHPDDLWQCTKCGKITRFGQILYCPSMRKDCEFERMGDM